MKKFILVLAFVLAGCATPQGKFVQDLNAEPTREEGEKAVLLYLSRSLKDPDSLKQFKTLGLPRPVTWYTGLLNGNYTASGWLICFEYNAKNSYGGYIGVKQDGFAVRKDYSDFYVVENVNWLMASARC